MLLGKRENLALILARFSFGRYMRHDVYMRTMFLDFSLDDG